MIQSLLRVHQGLRTLQEASNPDGVTVARQEIISDITTLSWLDIFKYLLDRLEDLIDSYLTPWTTVSVGSHIFSFGHGKAFIPLGYTLPMGITRQTYFGMLLRPVWWDYNRFSYTIVRNDYLFPPRLDFMDIIGQQQGFMVGFFGLHLNILRPGLPDTHLFLGRALLVVNKDLMF